MFIPIHMLREKASPVVHCEKFRKKSACVINFFRTPVGIVHSFNVFPKAVTRSKRKDLPSGVFFLQVCFKQSGLCALAHTGTTSKYKSLRFHMISIKYRAQSMK